jgi:rubredoxin
MLLRYVDALGDEVECPECGLPMEAKAAGVWHCRPCQLNQDIFDVLGTTDTDNHDIPLIPHHD